MLAKCFHLPAPPQPIYDPFQLLSQVDISDKERSAEMNERI